MPSLPNKSKKDHEINSAPCTSPVDLSEEFCQFSETLCYLLDTTVGGEGNGHTVIVVALTRLIDFGMV